jgi:hypothetical protein
MTQLIEGTLLAELEARQDDAMQQLDELDRRIEAAIAAFSPASPGATPRAESSRSLATIEMPRLADRTQEAHAQGQAERAA